MSYQKKVYTNHPNKGLQNHIIDVCCLKLVLEEEIGQSDGVWYCYGDGIIQISDIKFCPFCGEKLP